jgi:anti-anti-sigma factor
MSIRSHAELLQVTKLPDELLVRVCCREYDEDHARGLAAELFELVRARGERRLCLDLAEVTYLSSGMLGGLIVLDRKLQDIGGHLSVRNVHPQVYELFVMTRLIDILDVQPCAQVTAEV